LFVVFDLDDTLVDTSGCLVPHQTELALRALREAGLTLPPGSGEELHRLNREAASSQEAIEQFLEQYQLSSEWRHVALPALYPAVMPDVALYPAPGALELLAELARGHTLALVSRGATSFQKKKLEKAGIDTSLFSKIVIVETGSKQPAYRSLLEEFACPAREMWVCGDRVALDLSPAKQLGCTTVHVRAGRGKREGLSHPDVDYSIETLTALGALVTERNYGYK
jgi:putative hydrolase of the HAD superfamily